MIGFMEWTLNFIRNEGFSMKWLEERRVEWAPLLASRLRYFLDGYSFVFMCDKEREWFEKYFLQNINKKNKQRPIVPYFSLRALYPNLDSIKSVEDITLLEDMLDITFPNGYVYFYVGKTNSAQAQIAKNSEFGYLWVLDDNIPNSFYLNSKDESLDIKLLSLFKIFDASIDAVLSSKAQI